MRNIKKQQNLPEKTIDVYVSVTVSKPMKIKVNDYEVTNAYIDNDDIYHETIDYSNCNLKKAVLAVNNFEEFKNWNIDDFEVIMEKNNYINKSYLN